VRLQGLVLSFACGLTLLAAPVLAQDSYLILITGVSGDQEHATQFQGWATAILDSAKKSGLPDANVNYLAEQTERDPARIRARSTRDNVMKALSDTAAKSKPGDDVFVVLIGHGSAEGREAAAFNLPGPDLTLAEWGKLLDRFAEQRVVFVNTASSSGAFVEPLKKTGRTIMTATRTGGERNETRFPQYFVEAISSDAADRDRSGRVSMLEAFEYAQTKVKEAYEQGGHILTEHAVLEDGAQGKLAGTQFIAPDKARAAIAQTADPELRALLQQQSDLERQVAALRVKKDAMPPAEYEKQLEQLLTDLAFKAKEVRDRESKK
jgi:hypothetical protein